MAATVQIHEKNGPTLSPTTTDKTLSKIRFKAADDATLNLSDPIVRPAPFGTAYSYEKVLITKVTVAPTGNMTNVSVYCDGSSGLGTDITVYGNAVTSYVAPVNTNQTSAGGHCYQGGVDDIFAYTVIAPLLLGAGPFTGTGEKAKHLYMQAVVQSSAATGFSPAENLFFSFDET